MKGTGVRGKSKNKPVKRQKHDPIVDSEGDEKEEPAKRSSSVRKPFADRTNGDKSSEDLGASYDESELSKAKSICSSVKKRLSKPMFDGSDQESDLDLLETEAPGPVLNPLGPKPDPIPYKEEYERLLQKYNQLKDLRTTKAEELYAQHQANAEKREKGSLDKRENEK